MPFAASRSLRALLPWLALAGGPAALAAAEPPPFAPYAVDAQTVLDAIGAARPLALGGAAVTGLTLPHHRVASDLIATGMLTAARSARPDRIVLLTPDHFKRSPRAFATAGRDFSTVLGPVPVDRAAVRRLLAAPEVGVSVLFEREHGVGELLPYIARLFAGVPVLPVAIRIGATRAQWDRLVARLEPLVTPRTLVIQSTDFSHYLPRDEAVRRDQQMLNVIAAGDLDALARADQPAHLDSRGAQYVQMRLQRRRFGAQPIVYANRNSADNGATASDNTTSYIAQVYAPAASTRVVAPAATRTLCLAGDAFFGRHVARFLAEPAVRERVRLALATRLAGCPLVVNLEGVLTTNGAGAHPMQLAMPRADTLRWLRELGVVAVGVANNHARDLGAEAYAAMVADLRTAGLTVLEHGRPQAVGPLRLTALRDLDHTPRPRDALIVDAELVAPAADIAFLHWGLEYAAEPGDRERRLAGALRKAGVPLVVGAHPHRASDRIALVDGLDTLLVYSLGNFVFDQRAPRASGAVLQVSVFAQGTRAVRLIPLTDVYTLGRAPR